MLSGYRKEHHSTTTSHLTEYDDSGTIPGTFHMWAHLILMAL